MKVYELRHVDVFQTCGATSEEDGKVRYSVWSTSGTVAGVDEDFLIRAAEVRFRRTAKPFNAPNDSGGGRANSPIHVIACNANILNPVAIGRRVGLTDE